MVNKKIRFRRKHLEQIPSTNTYLLSCLQKEPLKEGFLVTAGFQTQGRGQMNNFWHSDPNENILMSLLLKPTFLQASWQFQLNMAMVLSVHDVVKKCLPDVKISIKWPNDIYAGSNKIAGMLIEHGVAGEMLNYSVVGIGLNINQTRFDPKIPNPVSLKLLTGKTHSLNSLLNSLKKHISLRYLTLQQPHHSLQQDYYNAMLGFGQERKYRIGKEEIYGIIQGVDEFGRLQLLTRDRRKLTLGMKEVDWIF